MATYSSDSLAVRDSLDDDDLSDVDDEVFIRDGKNGCKLIEDRGVKQPLMAPRRKICKDGMRVRKPTCRIRCAFYCYAIIALMVLLGLIMLTVLLVSIYPLPVDKFRMWFTPKQDFINIMRPCTNIEVVNVWNATFSKFTSESPIRSADFNQDGIDDIVLGYGTENGPHPFPLLCSLYFSDQSPCQGGLMALDGKTGSLLWKHWMKHTIYSLDCSADISGDKIVDCVAMGGGGILCAINGKDGSEIWQFSSENRMHFQLDIYSGQIIPDQDGDGIVDVIASHTIQKDQVRTGHIILISGKTGSEIISIPTPKNLETYYIPQLLIRKINNTAANSTEEQLGVSVSVLFGTGGQETPGALFVVPLSGFSTGKHNIMKPTLIYQDHNKGFLQPAVLVDINEDNIDDIIVSTFNSTVLAFDGLNYKQIWNFTRSNAETSDLLIPGYFNDDNITDFMIKFNVGKSFPTYYYSETVILDGKTGKPIFERPIIESSTSQLAGLSLSFKERGFDMFLYWMAQCKGYEDIDSAYSEYNYVLGSSIWEQSRADNCKLRFNTTLILKLFALNQHIQPPGILIFSSENYTEGSENHFDPIIEVKKYFDEHPKFDFDLSKITTVNSQSGLPQSGLTSNVELDNTDNLFKDPKFQTTGSSFRHKSDRGGLIRDFTKDDFSKYPHGSSQHKHMEGDELWPQNQESYIPDSYSIQDAVLPIDPNNSLADDDLYEDDNSENNFQNRDPRSKDNSKDLNIEKKNVKEETDDLMTSMPKKIKSLTERELLNELSTFNDYQNIQNARTRLLHDLSNVPSDILRETYLQNAEKELRAKFVNHIKNSKYQDNDLRTNKLEQRDLRFKQYDRTSVKKELESMYDGRRRESLWDLESEKEQYDREHGYWRGKREMVNINPYNVPKVGSTGILLKPLTGENNSIDIVFATYWLPVHIGAHIVLPVDKKCIDEKMEQAKLPTDRYHNLEKSVLEDLFTKMCFDQRGVLIQEQNFPKTGNDKIDNSLYLRDISRLSFGQMMVNRISLKCSCGSLQKGENCVSILNLADQSWPEFLGKYGKGYFQVHN